MKLSDMKRPHLVHCMAIINQDSINIKASVTLRENLIAKISDIELEIPTPKFPIQALRLLNQYQFTIKLVGFDKEHNEVFKKTYESDTFGNFNFKIPLTKERESIEVIQIYEIKRRPGLELLLGTIIPLRILNPKKIIICDFDKTLVDTKYSTTKEVYHSLTRPMHEFPTVKSSLEILKSYIDKGFHPFILSASPHFYEDAMRDWLYSNGVFSAGIFLKDYRHFFSFLEGELSPKDLKAQGLYKMNHLLDILLMTGIPNQLVLMGDNFESDPAIYLIMAKILKESNDPWFLWNQIKEKEIFNLHKKQNSQFLNKIFQLDNQKSRFMKIHKSIDLKIYIRKKFKDDQLNLDHDFDHLRKYSQFIELYEGLYQKDYEVWLIDQDNSVAGANKTI